MPSATRRHAFTAAAFSASTVESSAVRTMGRPDFRAFRPSASRAATRTSGSASFAAASMTATEASAPREPSARMTDALA
ncbi:MAG TPA: hypothetical protein VFV24_04305, partial [Candidatus Eisenbacteria bacterium]|nr:hypothetical protein [Candidatus Eisenbacteria bacterium]